jgi:hypothetical protein
MGVKAILVPEKGWPCDGVLVVAFGIGFLAARGTL